MKALAIIPARGGSKGIPNKNLQEICGKSLLEITVRQAQAADVFDEIVVTTDCAEIEAKAHKLGGVWVMDRPPVDDTSLPEEAERYVLEKMTGFDLVCRLFCTSPLRFPADISLAVHMVRRGGAAAVVSVTTPTHYPSQHVRISGEGFYTGHMSRLWRQPRQYWEDMRVLNGAVYVSTTEHYDRFGFFSEHTRLYEMPNNRSLDIDTPGDLKEAREIAERLQACSKGEWWWPE